MPACYKQWAAEFSSLVISLVTFTAGFLMIKNIGSQKAAYQFMLVRTRPAISCKIKKAIQITPNRLRAGNGSRTRDIDLGKVALYH